ncbi:MAG TPA: ABC transporter permease [Candidatus Koribacter sp.]
MLSIQQDLQYAVRQIKRNKTFSVVAVLTLALGIGANTAMFSVIYGVLLKPLPFRDPSHIVLISERAARFPILSASFQNYRDWKAQSHSFEQFGAVRPVTTSLTGAGEPEQIQAQMATGNLFQLLGVSTIRGRTLDENDDQPGSTPVVLIGYDLWQRRYNRSEDVLGKVINLGNKPYTIVGVLPPGYEVLQQQPEAVLPMGPWTTTLPDDRSWHPGIFPVARLRSGVTLDQARSEMSTIAKRLLAQYPVDNIALDAVVNPMQQQLVGNVRPVLMMLFGAVVFVLLIACGNVANLLLTRATARQKEMSVRVAIGASMSRVVRQLITEGILLSLLGAAAGIALAYAAMSTLVAAAGNSIPDVAQTHINAPVLIFTVIISILAGIVFGLAPASHLALRDLRSHLNESDRGAVSKHTKGLRGALVVAEIALAMLLMVGAGLFLRSFSQLANVDPGFSTEHILIADVPVSPAAYQKSVDRMNFFDSVLERVHSLPGVHQAAFASDLPVSGRGSLIHFNIQGKPPANSSEYTLANYRTVSAGYLQALSIPLIQGRWITDADREASAPVVVINREMAKTYFHDRSPLGQHLQLGATPDPEVPWMEVVGVVGDVKQSLAADAATEMYVPFRQADAVLPVYAMSLVVRSEGDPQLLANDVRTAIHQVNHNQPVVKIRTMRENVSASIQQPQFRTVLLTVFALIALLIAAVGIYGVMAYATSQRTRELGIRMALGSTAEGVFRLVLADGLRLTLIGVAIGIAASIAFATYLKSLLFGTSATDLLTLSAAAGVVVLVGLTASFVPARRAAHVQVSEILRES